MSYRISYEPPLGWVVELKVSDLIDRQAIVLEDEDSAQQFIDELRHAFENSLPNLIE